MRLLLFHAISFDGRRARAERKCRGIRFASVRPIRALINPMDGERSDGSWHQSIGK